MARIFYRSPDANPEPLEQLENSLTRFMNNANSHVILCRDFYLPSINWDTCETMEHAKHPKLLSILDDTGMCQSNLKPTRYENMLDLLITNSLNLVNRLETIPGLSDHDAIFGEVDISPQKITNNKPSVRVY